jgi:hypothetical protein
MSETTRILMLHDRLIGPGAKKSVRDGAGKATCQFALVPALHARTLENRFFRPVVAPKLKHQEGPKGFAMVTDAR